MLQQGARRRTRTMNGLNEWQLGVPVGVRFTKTPLLSGKGDMFLWHAQVRTNRGRVSANVSWTRPITTVEIEIEILDAMNSRFSESRYRHNNPVSGIRSCTTLVSHKQGPFVCVRTFQQRERLAASSCSSALGSNHADVNPKFISSNGASSCLMSSES